ncbi:MAG: flagellar brake protein [Herbaspirillum sp.]|jgi:c-di-GMP-binding flagellar brake protein YcgR|nr:flagellar brake protein [Herbaspirillum sp.]
MLNDDDHSDDNPFRVSSRREIVSLLNSMMDRNQLLSLMIKGGSESVITSILEVDEDNNALIMDSAPSAVLNEHILESTKIAFEALYNSIRITFAADRADSTEYDGRAALSVPIPASLIRLQRREYFRIATQMAKPIKCTINVTREDGVVMPIVTMLYNISAGGIGLTDDKCILDGSLGTIYENCILDLSDGPVIPIKLAVRGFKEVKLTTGKTVNRYGCEFVDIGRGALGAIQRFITKAEREQNAKAAGML